MANLDSEMLFLLKHNDLAATMSICRRVRRLSGVK
jgi:hypothetical protein